MSKIPEIQPLHEFDISLVRLQGTPQEYYGQGYHKIEYVDPVIPYCILHDEPLKNTLKDIDGNKYWECIVDSCCKAGCVEVKSKDSIKYSDMFEELNKIMNNKTKQQDKEWCYIAVYGSLRISEYNFERYNSRFPNQIEIVDTTVVRGFEMYDLEKGYPGIVSSHDDRKEITIDIIKVSGEVANAMELMERNAGYTSITVPIDGYLCKIYVYNESTFNKPIVESGDWSLYLRTNEVKGVIPY